MLAIILKSLLVIKHTNQTTTRCWPGKNNNYHLNKIRKTIWINTNAYESYTSHSTCVTTLNFEKRIWASFSPSHFSPVYSLRIKHLLRVKDDLYISGIRFIDLMRKVSLKSTFGHFYLKNFLENLLLLKISQFIVQCCSISKNFLKMI